MGLDPEKGDEWTCGLLIDFKKRVLAPSCKIKAQDGESISVFIPFAKIEDEQEKERN